jgi:hypothetical protein
MRGGTFGCRQRGQKPYLLVPLPARSGGFFYKKGFRT